MTRTFALLLSASALGLAACAEEAAETERAAENAGAETDAAMDEAGRETSEAMNAGEREMDESRAEADAAMDGAMDDDMDDGMDDGFMDDDMDDGSMDDGMRYDEGEDNPDGGLGQTPPVNAAQDAASIVVGTVAGGIAGLTGDEEAYVRNAYLANMYQIEAGRIAAERGGSEEVRSLGDMIASEHEAQQQTLETAVSEAGLGFEMPTELEGRRQGLLDNLNAASDTTFDSAFLQQQTQIHTELAALHNAYETTGDEQALVTFASEASDTAGEALERISSNYGAAVDGE
ncbi:MAG: DUF4142 domain-containing protein [Oceanicaulis sp.]